MSSLLYISLLVLFHHINTNGSVMDCTSSVCNGQYVCNDSICEFNCGGNGGYCSGATIYCDYQENSNCTINCDMASCINLKVISNRNTYIHCKGDHSCDYLSVLINNEDPTAALQAIVTVSGLDNDHINITCKGDGINKCDILCKSASFLPNMVCNIVDVNCDIYGQCLFDCNDGQCINSTLDCTYSDDPTRCNANVLDKYQVSVYYKTVWDHYITFSMDLIINTANSTILSQDNFTLNTHLEHSTLQSIYKYCFEDGLTNNINSIIYDQLQLKMLNHAISSQLIIDGQPAPLYKSHIEFILSSNIFEYVYKTDINFPTYITEISEQITSSMNDLLTKDLDIPYSINPECLGVTLYHTSIYTVNPTATPTTLSPITPSPITSSPTNTPSIRENTFQPIDYLPIKSTKSADKTSTYPQETHEAAISEPKEYTDSDETQMMVIIISIVSVVATLGCLGAVYCFFCNKETAVKTGEGGKEMIGIGVSSPSSVHSDSSLPTDYRDIKVKTDDEFDDVDTNKIHVMVDNEFGEDKNDINNEDMYTKNHSNNGTPQHPDNDHEDMYNNYLNVNRIKTTTPTSDGEGMPDSC